MGYKNDYVAGAYDYRDKKDNNEFALIVVLFILLIIVGTHFMKKDSYY
jgi:uncharacterized protein (TIGR01732 family)